MSLAALCLAVKDQLQDELGLDDGKCALMMDGQPPPSCGELFVAVHPGGWRPESDPDMGTDEQFGVYVTITRRKGYSPQDREGMAVWALAETGLDAVARRVFAALHKRYEVLAAANKIIGQTPTAASPVGFVEPLRIESVGDPEPKGPDWFTADSPKGSGKYANAGVAVVLRFGGARRLQRLYVNVT